MISLLTSSNPHLDARRAQVRRLYLRHGLSMGQIAARLGVSKPTVMRDVRWLRQQAIAQPQDELTALKRHMEDATDEAWYAYAHSHDQKETETETTWPATDEESGVAKQSIKRVRGEGKGGWQYLNLVGRLVERQVKLFNAPDKPGAARNEDEGRPNVVLYLPDNGRDRANSECGVRNAELTAKRERGNANDSTRSCGRETADAPETSLQSECTATPACSSSDEPIAPAIPLLTSSATVGAEQHVVSDVARHSNVGQGVRSPQNSTLECRATVSDDPHLTLSDTGMKRNVTICNGVEPSKVVDFASKSPDSASANQITSNDSSIPQSALRNPHSFCPQPGPQEAFLSTPADIAFYGGAAGGGKTWGMLFEALRKVDVPGFRAVVFRRTTVDITNAGGLWDQASEVYPLVGGDGVGTRHNLQWRWRKVNSAIQFAHLEHDSDRHRWQGSQLAMIGFEELTHFTETQFWYLLSRNRSTCGVTPYVRGTCNPDPDSWVRRFIEWWIDPQTGLPIPERSGRLRWFARVGDNLEWGDSVEELKTRHGTDCEPKSFTFIAANVRDNPALLLKNPGYLANLKALPRVEREQLLSGNWNIRATAGMVFRREWFPVVDAAPAASQRIRYWDRASTEPSSQTPNPDWTVGVLLARDAQGLFCVEDVVRLRGTPAIVEKAILNTASRDGASVTIGIEQDPAQAGKFETDYYIRVLAGYDVRAFPAVRKAMGDASAKLTRARPVSAQAQAGNIKLVRAAWNDAFLACLENFPEGAHDDDVDALSGAMAALVSSPTLTVVSTVAPNPRSESARARKSFEVEREFWRRAEEGAEKIRRAEGRA